MKKGMLVVYYSLSNGNTKRIAEWLQKATDADIVRIETLKPYTGSYNEIVEQGRQEVNRVYCPEIKPLGMNPADYDVIAMGTPTWWYTMAPAVLSFLKSCDWNGKTVIPFQTHGGWPGHVIKDIQKVCKGGGQILLCTAGRGYYQEWGKEAQELYPGSVAVIPAEVKHWHGAAPDSWFAHLAVEVPGEETGTEWCEAVSDEEYQHLK